MDNTEIWGQHYSGKNAVLLAFKDANGNFVPIPGPNSNDLKSETIPFATGWRASGTAMMESAANYQFSLTSLAPLQVILEATFSGDTQHWPAYARRGLWSR